MIFAYGDKTTIKSEDNGVNWVQYINYINILIVYKTEVDELGLIDVDERWVGSSINGGIFYSDDKGFTWNKSDIEEGVWGEMIKTPTFGNNGELLEFRIYAASKENSGILISLDAGKTWTKTSISFGEWEKLENSNNVINYETGETPYKNGLIAVGNDGAVFTARNTTITQTPDGEIITSAKSNLLNIDDKKIITSNSNIYLPTNISDQVDLITTHILNTIVYPYVSEKFTGYKNFPLGDLEKTNDKNETKINVKSQKEFYKMYKFSSMIDWEKDLGMTKIGDLKLSDIFEEDDDTEYIKDAIEGITEKNYLKTINTVKEITNEIKNKVNLSVINQIEQLTPAEGLQTILKESDEDYLDNDIKAYNFYVDTAKKSAESIDQIIVLNLYTFDEPMLRQLTRNALYEMVKGLRSKIKFELIEAIKRGDRTFNVFDIGLSINFRVAVKKALRKYAEDMRAKTLVLSKDNDRSLIESAATYYKNEERPHLLDEFERIVVEEVYDFDYSNISLNYNECVKDVNSFIEASKDNVDNDYHFKFYDYDFSEIKELAFIKLYKNICKRLEALKSEIITKEFYQDELALRENSEKLRTINYLKEIHNKFVDRCKELMMYIYTTNDLIKTIRAENDFDIKDHEKIEIKTWINNLDKGIIMFNDFNKPILEKQTKKALNEMFTVFLSEIEDQKENI